MEKINCKYCSTILSLYTKNTADIIKYYVDSVRDAFICEDCDVAFLYKNNKLSIIQMFRDNKRLFLNYEDGVSRLWITKNNIRSNKDMIYFDHIIAIDPKNFDYKIGIILNFR